MVAQITPLPRFPASPLPRFPESVVRPGFDED